MAQALIAGRVEQAILEERLLAREQCLSRVRGEALRLRSILERWHSEFVMPAVETSRLRRSSATVLTKAPAVNTGTPVNECLERKVLAVTADLLGARNEAAGLRAEITALRALVARVRQDEVRWMMPTPSLAVDSGHYWSVCRESRALYLCLYLHRGRHYVPEASLGDLPPKLSTDESVDWMTLVLGLALVIFIP